MKTAPRDRLRMLGADPSNGASLSTSDTLREAAFDAGPSAQVVLDANRSLVMANGVARSLFGIRLNDLGRPIQDLELSYRPVELRGHLDQMGRDVRPIDIAAVRWPGPERERVFNVHLAPLLGDGSILGTTVIYEDVTEIATLRAEVSSSKRELEEAYEELQSTVEELETTNEELQSTVEELETTNEELQSTNEELETTNEELQSTNEELETMNEELQSANEELETMNDELRHRTLELNEMNSFLETILTTIGLAVVVLDNRQYVQIWNDQARELWGVSADEAADQHLFALDIGIPMDELKQPLRACLTGVSEREELVVDAHNRRGKAFQCRVVCLPLTGGGDGAVSGVILLMEPVAAGVAG
jgi:two-component system CheB/CheR fusion protein